MTDKEKYSETYEQAVERTRSMKKSFIEKMSDIDLRVAMAVPVILGAAAVFGGVVFEAHHQSELMGQGMNVLQQYLDTIRDTKMAEGTGIADYVKAGISGELSAASSQTQAAGVGILAYGTAIAAAAATMAKGFANVVMVKNEEEKPAFPFAFPSQSKIDSFVDSKKAPEPMRPRM